MVQGKYSCEAELAVSLLELLKTGKVAAVVATPTPKSEKCKPAALNMAEIVKKKMKSKKNKGY